MAMGIYGGGLIGGVDGAQRRHQGSGGVARALALRGVGGVLVRFVVGSMLGVAFSAVRGKRYALKVAAFKLQLSSAPRLALLGTCPDRELAQQLGSTYFAVAGTRRHDF